MPLHYAMDDAKRRITVRVTDPYDAADLRALVDRQAAEGAWAYSMHYDSRPSTTVPATDQLRTVIEHVGALVGEHGPRGPVAIVTRTAAIVGVTQMYAFFGVKIGLRIEVFWDLQEADRWLAEQAGAREDTDN